MEKRLFIVSNRLPVTVSERGFHQASGGLITAIQSYLEKQTKERFEEVYWAGVPGCNIANWISALKQKPPESFTYLPVFAPEFEYENYYNGLSNSLLWPLFHYFPSFAEYNADHYCSYKKVNLLFADILLKQLRPSDTVWIHDYHLMPLAAILRKDLPQLKIGFFLHIPFPSFEIFRLMPREWQKELLYGVLGADLIGFHTMDYANHFLQSIQVVLGLDNERNIVLHDNRLIKVDVFPISIDFHKFNSAFDNERIVQLRNKIRKEIGERKLIFSVDRLDYTKGVHNRLLAFEKFLHDNPDYEGKVVFILVIVPSRDNIPKYTQKKREIDELISRINSKMGNIHWMPVIYQYSSLDFENLVALYGACDLGLITPLRDGMNLVSKEFVASRKDKRGVLVLSEMAGAARELTDALTINPNDITEMAERIKEGLEMPEEKQASCISNMQHRIFNYDVQAWAADFMCELDNIKLKQGQFQIKFIDEYSKMDIYDAYRDSSRRILLLDYDGTLMPFNPNPDMAVPDENLLQLLKSLADAPGNDVYLISGRNSSWLEAHFGGLPINLVAEHGASYKRVGENWESQHQTHNEWREKVHNVMEIYVRRCPNTFIEEKEFSLVWHYRNADMVQGKLRAYELVTDLNDYIHNRHLQVQMGNRIVEVRQSGINKGKFISQLLDRQSYDFVFAVGDDRTDEDMFKALLNRENVYSIKVGPDASYAKYNLYTPQMVVSLLEGMSFLIKPLSAVNI